MWYLLLMPLHDTVLEGGMPSSREWHRHIKRAPDEWPTGSFGTRNGASLPLASGEGQGVSFEQVMQEFHGILLLMQAMPMLEKGPPSWQLRNPSLSRWSVLARIGQY